MITIDNSGGVFELRTRRGLDTVFQIFAEDQDGNPIDFTGYQAIAQLDDGGGFVQDMPTTVTAEMVQVHLTGTLSQTLPSMSRASVEVVAPNEIRSSLCYIVVLTDGVFP